MYPMDFEKTVTDTPPNPSPLPPKPLSQLSATDAQNPLSHLSYAGEKLGEGFAAT